MNHSLDVLSVGAVLMKYQMYILAFQQIHLRKSGNAEQQSHKEFLSSCSLTNSRNIHRQKLSKKETHCYCLDLQKGILFIWHIFGMILCSKYGSKK